MTKLVADTVKLMQMLPESDQVFAHEFMKKLVLAWDPDFTKLTKEEAERLKEAESSEFVPADEIDWDNLEKYS